MLSIMKCPVRLLLKKQTHYVLFCPAAAVANILADIPFSAVQVFIYNLIIYFMSNLSRPAGGFFTYHLFVCSSSSLTGRFLTVPYTVLHQLCRVWYAIQHQYSRSQIVDIGHSFRGYLGERVHGNRGTFLSTHHYGTS